MKYIDELRNIRNKTKQRLYKSYFRVLRRRGASGHWGGQWCCIPRNRKIAPPQPLVASLLQTQLLVTSSWASER